MRTWTWVVSAALAGGLLAAGGCGNALLVHDPAPPYFGQRLAGAGALPSEAPPVRPLPGPNDRTTQSWASSLWRVNVPERPWRFIVVHHSASANGSAAEFDRAHREKGWEELGYHFVIGNGTGSGNGEIEIGGRWTKQKHGAHCKVEGHPEYNDFGIGICLVGNFDVTRPTEAQMAALSRLVQYLMTRYHIPRNRIYGHGQLKPTDCPGRNFDYNDFFNRL
jgi:N-acetyl-anhydromuramyl-L-alanine amidase AmpD